jgi:hypothetical protein
LSDRPALTRARVARRARQLWNWRWYLLDPQLESKPVGLSPVRLAQIPAEVRERVLVDADAVVGGHRECFGAAFDPTDRERWSRDPISGWVWPPGQFYQRYTLVDVQRGADVKLPWELSRCQHLLPVAKASCITGVERYSKAAVAEILDWIAANPFCRSINWTCAMEVAIRAVNWIWTLRLIDVDAKTRRLIDASLFQHGSFIFSSLEKHASGYSSNHYFADLCGLIHLALYFASDRIAQRWRAFAVSELYREVRVQFHATGPHYELATSYHRLVTEMLLSTLALLREHRESAPADVVERARNAVQYIRHYRRVDGSVPLIGDADDGRFVILGPYTDWDRTNHDHLLATGHAMFGDETLRVSALDSYEDAAWLLRDSDVFAFAGATTIATSCAYPDAGMYVLRSADDLIVVKTSNRGAFDTAGWHTHNDVLSFDLTLAGAPIVVDPGVGNYSGNVRERNEMRSTRKHATVMIDDTEQNTLTADRAGLWENGGEARSSVDAWESDADCDVLRARHYGYLRLSAPITHVRSFCYRKQQHALEIVDEFLGSGTHDAEWNFVLHPDVTAKRATDRVWLLQSKDVIVTCESDVVLELVDSSFSPSYLKKQRTLQLRGRHRVQHDAAIKIRFGVR